MARVLEECIYRIKNNDGEFYYGFTNTKFPEWFFSYESAYNMCRLLDSGYTKYGWRVITYHLIESN